MANVLTDLAADIYKAADVVGRELVGFIPSCTLNTSTDGAAAGDKVRAAFTRSVTGAELTPSMTIPEGTDQAIDNKYMTMGNPYGVTIPWTGEDMKHVNNGAGFETIYGDQIRQAMRAIVNYYEGLVAVEAYKNASRAYGTAGTTPFGSNFNEVADLRKILIDNGMPDDGQATLVINSAAGVKLRNLAQLQKANENGTDQMLRRGTLLDLQGLMIKESAQVKVHTAGAASGRLVNNASGYAIGSTSIAFDTGSGAFNAGDVVTFASDTNKYVVGATAATPLLLNGSGLVAAVADNAAINLGASYTANVAFHQAAIEFAMRAPAKPFGGDAAVDSIVVQDPMSGLVFEVSAYKGFQKAMFTVAAVGGVKAWKPEFIANLLG
jgi:hypothetical protein